jgi:diacylglycerol kinase (ATP)
LVNATRFSLAGLAAAYRHEQAFRLELLMLVFVVPAGLWLGKTGAQRALLIGSWCLVLVVELLNSAMEVLADRMWPEKNVLAGRAKDMGSAAVFCTIVLAAAVWLLTLTGQ